MAKDDTSKNASRIQHSLRSLHDGFPRLKKKNRLIKETSPVDLVWPAVSFLDLDVRLVADTVEILVQAVKQKCHQLL